MNMFDNKSKDNHKGPTILIVEDEDAIRNMYLLKLQRDGYDAYASSNAKEGMELAKSKKPDLMLVDLMMPETSGADFIEQLRGEDWGRSIQVIVLTNLGKSEAPRQLKDMGIERYIVKSEYTPSQVEEVIREVLHIG